MFLTSDKFWKPFILGSLVACIGSIVFCCVCTAVRWYDYEFPHTTYQVMEMVA